jgi:hypothetical protein
MPLNKTQLIVDSGVSPGFYTAANITVDAQGRVTLASDGVGGTTGVSRVNLNYTTGSLASGSYQDFLFGGSSTFHLLSISSDRPAWIRVYGSSSARSNDIRTEPGQTPPVAGSGLYAECATLTSPQSVVFSPVPLVQCEGGQAFVRLKNRDSVSRVISVVFTVLILEPFP